MRATTSPATTSGRSLQLCISFLHDDYFLWGLEELFSLQSFEDILSMFTDNIQSAIHIGMNQNLSTFDFVKSPTASIPAKISLVLFPVGWNRVMIQETRLGGIA